MRGLNSPLSRPLALLICSAGLLGTPGAARADLIINATFDGGDTPANLSGGGDLVTIFNTAVSWWEAAFKDPQDRWVVDLRYRWAELSPSLNAQFDLGSQGGDPHRIESGTATFNNTGTTLWFADPTPWDHSEYTQYEETFWQEPGGSLNVGRVFTGPTGDAVGRIDLLTIAAHEIGHALGLLAVNPASSSEIVVTPPRPFAGLSIFTFGGEHLFQTTALMGGLFANADERLLISGLDVLTEAQISQFARPNLDPYVVPEPASAELMLVGFLVLALYTGTIRRARVIRPRLVPSLR